jgi:hypothetical protein
MVTNTDNPRHDGFKRCQAETMEHNEVCTLECGVGFIGNVTKLRCEGSLQSLVVEEPRDLENAGVPIIRRGASCLKDVTISESSCNVPLSAPEVTGVPFCQPRSCPPLHPENGYNNDDLEAALQPIGDSDNKYREFNPLHHDVRDANQKHFTGMV